MIQKLITFTCPRCGSDQLVKNGHNTDDFESLSGTLEFGRPGTHLWGHPPNNRAMAEELHSGIVPPLRQTLWKARADDVLEVDEAWSFVGKKGQQRWLWTVMCRRPRQIIAYVIGDHSDATCKRSMTA